ncbi:MAG: LamG domain-containing protein [Bacteroidetes bacterium]|nr:LamG domain-containing protein [Bacteroidota bacterium]
MKSTRIISKLITLTMFITIILTVVTCKKKEDSNTNTPGFVIAPTAKFITDSDWQSMVTSIDSSNYTLTFDKGILSKYPLAQGDLIVSSVGNGLLRKIEVFTQSGNNVQVQTSQATLTDLIQEGVIDYKSSLSLSKIKSIKYYYKGIHLDTSNLKSGNDILFNWDFNTEIYPQVTLQGNFQYTSDFVFQIDIGILQGLKKVKFGFEGDEDFNLALVAGKQFNFSQEIPLATVSFEPILIPLPVLPYLIVVSPVFDLKLGANGFANASITTSLNQNISVETGVQYLKNGGWSSYMNDHESFTYNPPQLNMNAGAEAYIKPELRMLIYGVVGPYINAKGYGRIEADLTQNPWWKMYYGVTMSAGAKATILDILLFDFSVSDLLKWEQMVGQSSGSNSAPAAPSNPNPANNATNVSASTSLTWTCSDPDQDPLTYDVCFGTSSNPPVVANGVSSSTYTPSSLANNQKYYWKIVAKDNHGHSTPGNIWAFTTGSGGGTTPTVTTDAITNKTQTSATSGGNVTSDGGATVTAKGICWGTSLNPTTSNHTISGGIGTGTFVCTITGLSPNSTYHTRAYATNSYGTSYGADVQFTTNGATGLTASLVGYWKIDETTGSISHDAYGSNDCTVETGVTINESGLINKAASFIETSGGLTTGKTASELGLGGDVSKSVSLWIKPDNSINGYNSPGIINLGTKHSQQQFGIKYYGGGPAYWMFDSFYGAVRIGPDDDKLDDGIWHHMVVTYTSSTHTIRTYLDGSLVTTDATYVISVGDDMGFSIGIGSQGTYTGLIDEVGLWGRALSDSEVQALYNGGDGLPFPFK